MNFQILGPLRVTNGNGGEVTLGGAKPAALRVSEARENVVFAQEAREVLGAPAVAEVM